MLKQGCGPHSSTIFERNRSATNIFRSLGTLISRISLSFGSIATHNQIYSEPTLMVVSSIKYALCNLSPFHGHISSAPLAIVAFISEYVL
jgi:hypothetical protein